MSRRYYGSFKRLHRLSPEAYERRFTPEARAILESCPTTASLVEAKPERKRWITLKRRRRKLMPHDWAFILRESWQRYPEAVRHGTATGSKAEVLQALRMSVDGASHGKPHALRRMKAVGEANERRAAQEAHEKRNNLIRATKKEIARLAVKRRKVPTKTELADARAARTLVLAVDESVYEAIYARQIDSFPVPETSETAETILPARTGGIDWIRVLPRHDQYSPYLEYALDGVDRELFQSNSSSSWAYVVRLGDFVGEVERYEASFG